MLRREFRHRDLLLVLLALLDRAPTAEGELLDELDRSLGAHYRVTPSSVFIALAALEAERLVATAEVGASAICRITGAGRDALRERSGAPVLARLAEAERSTRVPEHAVEHGPQRVTVMFTDVVGSTSLLESLGEDAAHALRRRHFALLRGAIREHSGTEVKSLGDGLMVVFATRGAAIECGVSMQEAVAACSDSLELRIGIASGEAVREDSDYFGRPVIVARRLCDCARGGQVLVAGGQAPRSGAYLLDPCGELLLKGLSEPVAASAVRAQPLAVGT